MAKTNKVKKILGLCGIGLAMAVAAVLCYFAMKLVAKSVKANIVTENKTTQSVIKSNKEEIDTEDQTEYGDYTEISKQLAALASTHEVWTDIDEDPEKTGFYCIATKDLGSKTVFNIDPENICGHKLADYDYIWVDSVNSSFYAVINIPGEVVDLSNYYILVSDDTGNLASRLIINCYEATAVLLDDAIITGTLLAPKALVQYSNTVVYGAVLAKSATGVRTYYKEIAFGGMDVVLEVTGEEVAFQNYNMNELILASLKEEFPARYAGYDDSYVLKTGDLEKLTKLSLEDAMIVDLYDDLKYATNLEELSVKNTYLTKIDISGMEKLKKLDISGSKIEEIVCGENCCLETLVATKTPLAGLHTENLGSLKVLDLTGTTIFDNMQTALRENKEIATGITFENLFSLTELYLGETGFEGFETAAKEKLAKKLTVLDVSENKKLTKLDLTGFGELKTLVVSGTGITTLELSETVKLVEIKANYLSTKVLDLSAAKALLKVEAYGDSYTQIIVPSSDTKVSKLANTEVVIK